jgi:hypothetical protein
MLHMSTEEILAAVLALDPKTRAEVAHQIIASLDELSDEENERLWAEESDRRVKELREGRAKEIPGKQVLADARSLLR